MALAPRVCHRDTVELAQCLDMAFDTFGSFGRTRLSGITGPEFDGTPVCAFAGFSQQDQVQRLKNILTNNYDVLIMGGMCWAAFPSDIQAIILEKVEKGTGLVIGFTGSGMKNYVPGVIQSAPTVGQTDSSWVCSGIPFTALYGSEGYKSDREAAMAIVSLKQFGKGRVAILSLGGNSENTYFVPPLPAQPAWRIWQVDYYFSLAAKAVLWASGKNPAKSVVWTVKNQRIVVDGDYNAKSAVQCVKIRNDLGEIAWEKDIWENEIALPSLAPGKYLADIVLKKEGKNLDWGTCVFEIKGDAQISSVAVTPAIVESGSSMSLSTMLEGNTRKELYLNVRLWDMYERLLGEITQKAPPGQKLIQTKIDARSPLTCLMKGRLVLNDAAGHEVSHKEIFIPVKIPYIADDFGFLTMEDGFNEYPWYYARKEMRALGMNLAYTKVFADTHASLNNPWMLCWVNALAGIQPVPWITSYRGDMYRENAADKTHYERTPCLSDPEYITMEKERIHRLVREAVVFGPPAYCLGDENFLSLNDVEMCFSKHCMEGFRKYLKALYLRLEALNSEWGSRYKTWNEITPLTLAEARALDQPARWVDFRLFMERVFLGIHQAGAAAAREYAPDARVGFDGLFNTTSFTGYDWWQLSQNLDFLGVYPDHLQTEILRSFHKNKSITGRWCGGYRNLTSFKEYGHWEPWHTLFHEMNTVWWYNMIERAANGIFCSDTMNPTSFQPFPVLQATSTEVLEIKGGIGKLLLNAKRDTGGIAILYSQSSLHAATYYAKHGNSNDSALDFIRILEDLCHQYRFISYEQLAQGILTREKYKLIILPSSIALSEAERDALMAFSKSGGHVVADTIPGIYDEHGKPLVPDMQWAEWQKNSVEIVGDKVRGYKRGKSGDIEQRHRFSGKLSEKGISPEFSVKTDKGDLYEGELVVFSDHDTRYVGMLRSHSPAVKNQGLVIILPEKRHVYNVRAGRYLGYQDRISDELKPGMAGLWALFPSEQPKDLIMLNVQQEADIGGNIEYSVRLKTESPGCHVVRITVKNPDGIAQKHYSRNLIVRNGAATDIVPLALSDKAGSWRIHAMDVATGSSINKRSAVKRRGNIGSIDERK
ncbi:MAG: beta-galactosidase [Kiritimatiellae bacterium]|nr:beta-galactosidase [Kiritimatiellia bacterium]